MLEITRQPDGTFRLEGRFDASQAEKAKAELAEASGPTTLDCVDLQYVSSAGLGVLFATHRRLMEEGGGLKLIHLNAHIREVFHLAGFDTIFEVE